jgi:hypothetical protein
MNKIALSVTRVSTAHSRCRGGCADIRRVFSGLSAGCSACFSGGYSAIIEYSMIPYDGQNWDFSSIVLYTQPDNLLSNLSHSAMTGNEPIGDNDGGCSQIGAE